MADHYWWQYWAKQIHHNLRVKDSDQPEFDVDKLLWDHDISFSGLFEAMGIIGDDLQRLKQTAVYKFGVAGEGCDAFVDRDGRHCLAKTAYHPDDADGVKQVLRQLVGGRVEVETYVNGPKPYVWVFRVV